MKAKQVDLLQHIANGHPDRFLLIYRAYGETVRRMVCRMVMQREDAEELVQNTFVNAFHHLHQYDAERASLLTWIMRIAANEVGMYFRRKSPPMLSLDDADASVEIVDDGKADCLLSESSEERISMLQQAVRLLPADEQMLLHLYYTDHQPLRDIALILDATPNQLAKRLQRIRKKLCAIIIKMEKDGNE